MKSFIINLMLLLVALEVHAQNSLSGHILDKETNQPLVGAQIFIPDLQNGATTDNNGRFEIKNLPGGTFLIEVSFISYSTQVVKTTIQGKTILDVQLSPAISEMSEIIITGTSSYTERDFNPIPTIVISNISSNETPSTNIIDAIAKQPGVSQVTTGSAISKPVIRGLGYNRIVVLNNNVRQEGQQWGDEHGIEIDEYSVGRVEIIKGPGSLMYGSDAMAGVINFLAPKPVTEGKIIGNVMCNYQSNNNLLGYSAMNAGNIKGVHWLARVSSKTAGNYSNSFDGKVYNSGFKELNFNGAFGVNKKWGYSKFQLSRFQQTVGLIEGERDDLGNFVKPVVVNDTGISEQTVTKSDLMGYKIGIPRQEISHFKMGSNSRFFLKKSILSLNVAFQQNSRKEFANPLNEQATELFFLLNTLNYDIKYQHAEMNGWLSSIGMNGMLQNSYNKGEDFLIPEYNLADAGIFIFTQKSFDRLYVSGGIRFDIRSMCSHSLFLNTNNEPTDASDTNAILKFKSFNATFSNLSASAGASYRLNQKLTTKLNVSRGFRSPNMAELSSNGRHEGTFRYELGNTKLKPETSLQSDVGLLYNSAHLSLELALFNNYIQNFIFLQKLNGIHGGDSIVDPSDPSPTFQFIQGKANLYGGEFAIDLHPHPLDWLHFENSIAFVRGQQANQSDTARYLPFMPATQIQSELRASFKKVGTRFHNFYLRVDMAYTFEQAFILSAYGTETASAGYTLFNAGIGSDVVDKNGITLFSLTLAAGNLLDVSYQSHLSRLKYAPQNQANGRTGVFNMGRNYSIRLLVPLNLKKAV